MATISPYEEDIIHLDLISDFLIDEINDINEDFSEEEFTEGIIEDNNEEVVSSGISPQNADYNLELNTYRSNRTWIPQKLLKFIDFQAAKNRQEIACHASDMGWFMAGQANTKEPPINPKAVDTSPFMFDKVWKT